MRYDVFLSFIGEDIRRTFLSHLLHSLHRKGITSVTSVASNPSETQAFRWSLVSVSVISKKYTSLDLWVEEQARIIGPHRKVVPVFLRVDPLDVLRVVRLAQDSVNIHEPWGEALEKVKNWLDGHVTSQSGFKSSDWEDDSQLVEQITCFISEAVTQASISRRWFPRLDWLRSPWEESDSLEDTYGLHSIGIHKTSFRPSSPSLLLPSSRKSTLVSHSSNPSETFIEPSSYVGLVTPVSHSSINPSETVIEPLPDVAPMTPMSHSINPSEFVNDPSFTLALLNRSNRSETIIEEASSGPRPRGGMNHRVEEVLSMLQPEYSTEEVRTVGICGVEGVGKTTLAKSVYDEISSQFQHHFFMSNFSQKGNSLLEILASETTNFNGSSEVIEDMVGRKVLLVADSIADIKQLKSLAKEVSLFGPGSRAIVITQHGSLLFECGVKHIYEVGCPGDDEAIQLFSQFAFMQINPLSGFERFSGRAVEVAGHIPLALKVLGSYLHGRGQDEWESTLCRLEKTHNNNYTTEEVLKYIGADVSARQTRAILELEENEENDFPLYFFTLE